MPVTLAEPLKLPDVYVTSPVRAMVRPVCSVVAVVAFPDSAPDTVPTTNVFVLGLYVNVASESCSSP